MNIETEPEAFVSTPSLRGGNTTLLTDLPLVKRTPTIRLQSVHGRDCVVIRGNGQISAGMDGLMWDIYQNDQQVYDMFREWFTQIGVEMPRSEDSIIVKATCGSNGGENGVLTLYAKDHAAGQTLLECLRIDPDGTLHALGQPATPDLVVKALRMFLGLAS